MEKPDAQQRPAPTRETPSEEESQPKNDALGASPTTQKPSFPRRIWTASGLDFMTLTMMFKGAIAPTIALAIYQATSVAKIYSTLGYLVAIMSVLSMPIMPRSKFVSLGSQFLFCPLVHLTNFAPSRFIQNLFLDLIGICIGSCIALLTIYCSVQARKHTTPHVSDSLKGNVALFVPMWLTAKPVDSQSTFICAFARLPFTFLTHLVVWETAQLSGSLTLKL